MVEERRKFKKYDQKNHSMISDPIKTMEYNVNMYNKYVVSPEEEVWNAQ